MTIIRTGGAQSPLLCNPLLVEPPSLLSWKLANMRRIVWLCAWGLPRVHRSALPSCRRGFIAPVNIHTHTHTHTHFPPAEKEDARISAGPKQDPTGQPRASLLHKRSTGCVAFYDASQQAVAGDPESLNDSVSVINVKKYPYVYASCISPMIEAFLNKSWALILSKMIDLL